MLTKEEANRTLSRLVAEAEAALAKAEEFATRK
jgi:hypothetical protein